MTESKFGIKIFSLDEANLMLPLVRAELARLRELRRQIVSRQSLVDVEEMAGNNDPESGARVSLLLAEIEREVLKFHRATEELHAAGCELKDLDKGLVDFYGMRDNEVVYLCWMEGEAEISHWHTLDAGFKGRQSLEH